MLSDETAAQIAHHLRNLPTQSNDPFAFLADAQTILFSSADSPVVSLIQAVYDHHAEQARRILRSRIFTSQKTGEMEHGMVKISAKRITSQVLPVDHAISLDSYTFKEIRPHSPPPLVGWDDLPNESRDLLMQKKPMAAAFRLARDISREKELYESDRQVAAILVSESGDFIAASRNANAKNKTRHAELNLIQGLWRERKAKLPPGSQIYVTLKCCKMCAGAIWDNAEDVTRLRVIYGLDDPGPGARNTAFSRAKSRIEFQEENVSYQDS